MLRIENFAKFATSGNRTRASRVAGENSTTEPTLLENLEVQSQINFNFDKLSESI